MRIEEIMAEGIPSPPRNHTHYYVSTEDGINLHNVDSTFAEPRERLQALMKSNCRQENLEEIGRPRLGIEAQEIARKNREVAKARLEEKKQKLKHGTPFPTIALPALTEHLEFYDATCRLANQMRTGAYGVGHVVSQVGFRS